MRTSKFLERCALYLACLGLLIPRSALLAEQFDVGHKIEDVALDGGGVFHGRVVDAQGQPVAMANVRMSRDGVAAGFHDDERVGWIRCGFAARRRVPVAGWQSDACLATVGCQHGASAGTSGIYGGDWDRGSWAELYGRFLHRQLWWDLRRMWGWLGLSDESLGYRCRRGRRDCHSAGR